MNSQDVLFFLVVLVLTIVGYTIIGAIFKEWNAEVIKCCPGVICLN